MPLVFCALGIDETHKALYDKGRPVPRKADIAYDCGIVFGIVAAGWFWTALVYVFSTVAQDAIYTKPPKVVADPKGVSL